MIPPVQLRVSPGSGSAGRCRRFRRERGTGGTQFCGARAAPEEGRSRKAPPGGAWVVVDSRGCAGGCPSSRAGGAGLRRRAVVEARFRPPGEAECFFEGTFLPRCFVGNRFSGMLSRGEELFSSEVRPGEVGTSAGSAPRPRVAPAGSTRIEGTETGGSCSEGVTSCVRGVRVFSTQRNHCRVDADGYHRVRRRVSDPHSEVSNEMVVGLTASRLECGSGGVRLRRR
ncbi:hypothetical protein SAMN04489718_1339 [Actinopolyspora saharensis]|uniref:Uncharacterized protein n=1 Tax=Actinopolyspora saharensis TaxID=995062 RepID=A0A1H1A191_9ACTN|nr:hypothetical protein SAMN04489718_1339 [Actinopolyspora saharensis]